MIANSFEYGKIIKKTSSELIKYSQKNANKSLKHNFSQNKGDHLVGCPGTVLDIQVKSTISLLGSQGFLNKTFKKSICPGFSSKNQQLSRKNLMFTLTKIQQQFLIH